MMKTLGEQLRSKPWFERAYKIAVAVKGIDGFIELAAGVGLLIFPSSLHMFLSAIIGEANEHHNGAFQFLAEYVTRVDSDLLKSGLIFLIAFLITHGLVKLALVYCLLKEIVRAYPVALIILVLFFFYQIYVFVMTPGIAMGLFMLLDAIIIWLVWNEYQELKSKK